MLVCSVSDIKLVRKIGEGAFGDVYLSLIKKEYYAVKIMSKKKIMKLKQQKHVVFERNIALSIEQPFVVKTYATLQSRMYLYVVMEYVPGGEMFSFLEKVDVLPVFAAVFYISELVVFIEEMHKENIIYRDLKPENILLGLDGHIKITDFGLSKKTNDITYTACGTPEYLAPEVILSKGYKKDVDWYMIGIILFEMLTGNPPFMAEKKTDLYRKIVNEKVVFPSDIDSVSVDLISKLLEKDPLKRLGSAKESSLAIKRHPWFKSVNWKKVYAKKVNAPYKPTIKCAEDVSNFEEYTDLLDISEEGKDLSTEYGDGFDGFEGVFPVPFLTMPF